MAGIEVKSNKYEKTLGSRTVTVPTPPVLESSSLEEMIAASSEKFVFEMAMAQALINYRAHVRNRMDAVEVPEKSEENPDPQPTGFSNSDEKVVQLAGDWKPVIKDRLSAADKAKQTLSGLGAEDTKKVLQSMADDAGMSLGDYLASLQNKASA